MVEMNAAGESLRPSSLLWRGPEDQSWPANGAHLSVGVRVRERELIRRKRFQVMFKCVSRILNRQTDSHHCADDVAIPPCTARRREER